MAEHEILQGVINTAYDRWQPRNDWGMRDFWDQLDYVERVAVHFGKLNGEVCNGGFMQWADNGYYTEESASFMLRTLDRMGAEQDEEGLPNRLKKLLTEALEVLEDHGWDPDRRDFRPRAGYFDEDNEEAHRIASQELDLLDTRYYQIDDAVLDMIEEYVVEQQAEAEEEPSSAESLSLS